MRSTVAASQPRARVTGAVYLAYFVAAIAAQIAVGRAPVSVVAALNVVAIACYVAVTLLFYELFKPVNRAVSLTAALFSLAGCTVMGLRLFHVAPAHVSEFFFFGFYCVLIGCLTVRSTFLPRVLGLLLVVAGAGWLVFAAGPRTKSAAVFIEGVGILAEASLMVWLLIVGVNVENWRERHDAANRARRAAA